MNIYLNDLSMKGDNSIDNYRKEIRKFNNLMNTISSKAPIDWFAPANLWHIPICGYDVGFAKNGIEGGLQKELHKMLCEIFKKFKNYISDYHLFYISGESDGSFSLGQAAKDSSLVISFTFDGHFKTDTLQGCLDDDTSIYEINNFYEDKPDVFQHLVDISQCRYLNPIESPLWNASLARERIKDIDFVHINDKERQALLIEYGRKVAEMNGWEYNKRISDLNSDGNKLRYIFDSRLNFPDYPTAYLCIDLEGPNLAFELCDNKGRHKGEYGIDGNVKEPRPGHDIRLK